MTKKAEWSDKIYRILREWDVTQFSYVPDSGNNGMIQNSLKDPNVHSVPLTTEEEGVAMLVGAHLGLARGVVMMQSSGVGNCVNMFSYVKNGQYPMLILVSMRGEFGERASGQFAMGQAVKPILESCGFICLKIKKSEDLKETIQAACAMVYTANQAVAVLLSQRLIGAKMI